MLLLCVGVLLVPGSSDAATLYFDPAVAEINRGDTVTVAVRIDTDEDECINAADVVVTYSDAVRAVDVSRGESIFNVWVEDPVIDAQARTISFAGGIPGGYCGRIAGDPRLTNILAELVFRLPGFNIGSGAEGSHAAITFTDASQVLLHDGRGTQAPLTLRAASLHISDTPGTALDNTWRLRVQDDDIPPADFSITLAKDPNAFSGNYFITFNSNDKQSGIAHYEVMEEPFEEFNLFAWERVDAPWVEATSPYVLTDQSLNSTIRVKAVDKASNETFALYVPDAALREISAQRMIGISVGVSLAVLLGAGMLYAMYRRRNTVMHEYEQHHDKI